MQVTAVKTSKVHAKKISLEQFLDVHITCLEEKSILVLSSKIVALAEGRFIKKDTALKESFIQKEADYYLPASESRYGIPITIKDNAFIAKAGIDSCNTDGVYSLLPKDSYATCKKLRAYLCTRFALKEVGVIIVDSHSTPLRRGTLGVAIGWSGFQGIKAYENVPDIFGQRLTTHANHVDALAATAVLAMGEGNEQTPLVKIQDTPLITFSAKSPTKKELSFLKPPIEDDLFAPILDMTKFTKRK